MSLPELYTSRLERMTMDHEKLLESFERIVRRRNMLGLRLAALLITLLFPLFWLLDWVALPGSAMITLWLRLCGILFSLAIWIATFRHSDLVYRHTNSVAIALGLLIGCLIAIMAWLDDGYESPYYAGLNLVILGASFLFVWPLRLSLGFNALLYGFYIGPLLTGYLAVDDPGVAITNHSFLLSTVLISVVAQQYRRSQERKDYVAIQHQQCLLRHVEGLAATDPLTGLCNRRQFFTLAGYELPRARRLDQQLSIFVIDIDNFKRINDTHGHLVGDEILRAAADVFQSNLRQQDVLARLGGDEFVALLPDTDSREASLVADRVRLSMQTPCVSTTQLPVQVTVSIGVASLTEDLVDFDSLLLRSDNALYEAKRSGRNRVCVWHPHGKPESRLPVP